MPEKTPVTTIGENNNIIVRADNFSAAHTLKKRKVKGGSRKSSWVWELMIETEITKENGEKCSWQNVFNLIIEIKLFFFLYEYSLNNRWIIIHWMINWFIKWISEYVNYSPNDYPNIKFNWLNEYWMNEYSMSATSNTC